MGMNVSVLSSLWCSMSLAWRARILNFLLPGAGLCSLREWKQAALNFLLSIGGIVAAIVWGSALVDEFHYVWLAIASGSAGWAHAVAMHKLEATEQPAQPSARNSKSPRSIP